MLVMTTSHGSLDQLVAETGRRLRQERLNRNFTQAELAERAGVSVRTLTTLETGEGNPTLRTFFQVLRALDLLDRLDALLPEPGVSPVELAKLRGRQRERASGARTQSEPTGEWEWRT